MLGWPAHARLLALHLQALADCPCSPEVHYVCWPAPLDTQLSHMSQQPVGTSCSFCLGPSYMPRDGYLAAITSSCATALTLLLVAPQALDATAHSAHWLWGLPSLSLRPQQQPPDSRGLLPSLGGFHKQQQQQSQQQALRRAVCHSVEGLLSSASREVVERLVAELLLLLGEGCVGAGQGRQLAALEVRTSPQGVSQEALAAV